MPLLLIACGDSDVPGAGVTERVTRVTVAQPQSRDIKYVLSTLGSLESLQHPTISAETNGQIISIEVAEGDVVAAQQQLAAINSTLHAIESAKAAAELQRQSVVLENQHKRVARLRRLATSQSVSQDQLEDQEAELAVLEAQRSVAQQELQRAQYMESRTRILASQAGLIARRHISLGDYVTPGTPLFDLVSVDRLRARMAFGEHSAADIKIGNAVMLKSPVDHENTATGTVTSINPQINIHSRTIEVIVEFDNPGGWLPGASVDATLVVKDKPQALTLPPNSLVTRDNREVVFAISNGRAQARAVETGWTDPEWVEILNGVTDGDRVVVEGAALIDDGSLVEVVE